MKRLWPIDTVHSTWICVHMHTTVSYGQGVQQQVSVSTLSSTCPWGTPVQGSTLYDGSANFTHCLPSVAFSSLPSGLSLRQIMRGHFYWQPFGSWLPWGPRGSYEHQQNNCFGIWQLQRERETQLNPIITQSLGQCQGNKCVCIPQCPRQIKLSHTVNARGVSFPHSAASSSPLPCPLQSSVEDTTFITDFWILENTPILF